VERGNPRALPPWQRPQADHKGGALEVPGHPTSPVSCASLLRTTMMHVCAGGEVVQVGGSCVEGPNAAISDPGVWGE
jgi:hypothetical protein